LTEGYQVKIDQDVIATWTGDQIDADADIPMIEGWNIVPYYPTYQISADSPDFLPLSSIIDHVIVAKDSRGNFLLPDQVFSNMKAWKPTKGYFVKVNDDVTLNYPEEPEEQQASPLVCET
jgi:hypothetical protein